VADPWRLRLALLDLLLDAAERVLPGSELIVDVQECRGDSACSDRGEPCGRAGCVELTLRALVEPLSRENETLTRCAFDIVPGVRRFGEAFGMAAEALDALGASVRVTENDRSRRTVEVRIPLDAGSKALSRDAGTGVPAHPRALVADDEGVIRELAKSILTDEGYDVAVASSGREAVNLARSQAFNVALLDLMMPGEIEGLAALREIRVIQPGCRIVLMTGCSLNDELEAQLRLADSHVIKPFQCRDLVECVRKPAG
jgi:CheY-like chemotaxis protein